MKLDSINSGFAARCEAGLRPAAAEKFKGGYAPGSGFALADSLMYLHGAMDKKALTRQYKETRRPMGVYQVRNTVNGKVLIGVSVDLPSMLNRQQSQLRMGGHPNRELQKDWAEFGPEAFEFEILDTLTPPENTQYDPKDDLRALEQLWLDNLSPFGERGYNVKPKHQ